MSNLRQLTIRTVRTEPLTCPDHRTYRYTDPVAAEIALNSLGLPLQLRRKAQRMATGSRLEADIGLVHVEISVKQIQL